ncbi:MAG: cytochrome-c peroxidase [Chitinophagales bacterium]|jgi:cytochrome c peroxidase|nr:cytochrome-c peroxidase [Chitinophagales bacterium]
MQQRKLFFILGISCILYLSLRNNEGKQTLPDSEEKLGELLFFDKILSRDSTMNCASCHIPAFAFADTAAVSIGVDGRKGRRNSPSIMNMSARDIFFYDGRAETLEAQVAFPIQDHLEMNINIDDVTKRLTKSLFYRNSFQQIYGKLPTNELLMQAIAAYERTLESYSAFDRYMSGDSLAISAEAKRGHKLFVSERSKCFECHFSPDFTGDEFKNIGLFDAAQYNDSGRYLITKDPKDIGKFKVPGLRNVAVTAPYMHNGSMKTLDEVLDFYNDIHKVVKNPINLDSTLRKPLHLTKSELQDIKAFLISLTDDEYMHLLK